MKRLSQTILITVVLSPFLYLLSVGPACWWFAKPIRMSRPSVVAPDMYWPIGFVCYRMQLRPNPTKRWIVGVIFRYAQAGRTDGCEVYIWADCAWANKHGIYAVP